jgi:hypothetical protein
MGKCCSFCIALSAKKQFSGLFQPLIVSAVYTLAWQALDPTASPQ